MLIGSLDPFQSIDSVSASMSKLSLGKTGTVSDWPVLSIVLVTFLLLKHGNQGNF